jgi:hypothetical protein
VKILNEQFRVFSLSHFNPLHAHLRDFIYLLIQLN